MAIANRHSSPPYRWATALHIMEEGVFCRKMINLQDEIRIVNGNGLLERKFLRLKDFIIVHLIEST